MRLTRVQYYRMIKVYQEQVEHLAISANYYNVGTIFDAQKYNSSRKALLVCLAEMVDNIKAKYLSAADGVLSNYNKRRRKNMELVCGRIQGLISKINQGKDLTSEDYKCTYIGLVEIFMFGFY